MDEILTSDFMLLVFIGIYVLSFILILMTFFGEGKDNSDYIISLAWAFPASPLILLLIQFGIYLKTGIWYELDLWSITPKEETRQLLSWIHLNNDWQGLKTIVDFLMGIWLGWLYLVIAFLLLLLLVIS